ncbi:phage holin family protein [Paenibacillus sp. VCA1]|uniref:phage holin family protein n=1 Tax=Paenibacillus sp. VCA1 TaxID=3039148 RepID=UPI002871F187|nr:phage holin family protein [Paenibacillus sp. VCA1]MDR9855986.1 phage holin family protein [Paenibacillus sp. VCA1]
MDWNTIYNLIDPKLMIVIALCWVIGYILKRTPRIPDWCIVYVVTLAAVLLTIWLLGFGPEPIIQGILAGAFAVYGNQLVKQARKKGNEDKSLWF